MYSDDHHKYSVTGLEKNNGRIVSKILFVMGGVIQSALRDERIVIMARGGRDEEKLKIESGKCMTLLVLSESSFGCLYVGSRSSLTGNAGQAVRQQQRSVAGGRRLRLRWGDLLHRHVPPAQWQRILR